MGWMQPVSSHFRQNMPKVGGVRFGNGEQWAGCNPFHPPTYKFMSLRDVDGGKGFYICGPSRGVHDQKQEQESISQILEDVKSHSNTLEIFQDDHSGQAASIEDKARDTCIW